MAPKPDPDERFKVDLDPEEFIKGILAVDPDADPVEVVDADEDTETDDTA